MFSDALPYLALITLYVTLSFYESFNNSNKTFVRFTCFIIYILFFGASGYIGSDWYNYKEMYDLVEAGKDVFNIEVGFLFLIKISVFLGLPFAIFKFFIFVLQGYLLDRFLNRYVKNISFYYFLLISLAPLLIIDAYRNFTAILIILNAIPLLLSNRVVSFVTLVIFGCLFHVSVIVYVVLIFMRRSYFNRMLLILLAALFLLFVFVPIGMVPRALELFTSVTGSSSSKFILYFVNIKPYGLTFGVIEKFLILIFLILTYNFSFGKLKVQPIFFNCTCVYLFIYLFGYEVDFIIERFSLLFVCLYFVFLVKFVFGLGIRFNRYVFFLLMLSFGMFKAEMTFDKPIYRYSNSLTSTDNVFDRERIRYVYYTSD